MSDASQVNAIIETVGRVRRGVRDLLSYCRLLKNGFDVLLNRACKRTIPPLKFRNGLTWYHGDHDQPLDLFREIYVDRFYEPLSAPSGAVVVDIGANIGAVSLLDRGQPRPAMSRVRTQSTMLCDSAPERRSQQSFIANRYLFRGDRRSRWND